MERHNRGIFYSTSLLIESLVSSFCIRVECCKRSTVGVDKPPYLRIIIPTAEVVEPRLAIVVIPTIPNRVQICDISAYGKDIAPGVIGVTALGGPPAADDRNDVALEIQDVVVHSAVVIQRIGLAGVIVDDIHHVAAPGLLHHLAVLSQVVAGHTVNGLAVSDASQIIGITDNMAALGGFGQLPSVGPAQAPVTGAIVPNIRVANGIVGNRLAVVGSQQVQPVAVTVGVGVGCCTADTADVAVGVIGVVIGSVGVDLLGQLPLRIVGIAGTLICPGFSGDLRDVACLVILIAQVELCKFGTARSLGIVNRSNLRGLVATVGAAGGLDLRHHPTYFVYNFLRYPANEKHIIISICSTSI